MPGDGVYATTRIAYSFANGNKDEVESHAIPG